MVSNFAQRFNLHKINEKGAKINEKKNQKWCQNSKLSQNLVEKNNHFFD